MAERQEKLTFCYDSSQTSDLLLVDAPDGKEKESKAFNQLYEANGEDFKVRGSSYLTDKVKIASTESSFEFITFFVIEYKTNIWHAAENLRSLKTFLANYPDDFFIIYVRQVPAKRNYSAIVITRQKKDTDEEEQQFGDLLNNFLKSDEGFKNKRLKYIPRLENAPWAILTSVKLLGGEKPVIMGNGYLKMRHYSGANYYEVDVDISSSRIAKQIAGTVVKWSHKFKVTECFVIEGQSEEELPEKVLCCWTLVNVKVPKITYELTEEDLAFFKENPNPPADLDSE